MVQELYNQNNTIKNNTTQYAHRSYSIMWFWNTAMCIICTLVQINMSGLVRGIKLWWSGFAFWMFAMPQLKTWVEMTATGTNCRTEPCTSMIDLPREPSNANSHTKSSHLDTAVQDLGGMNESQNCFFVSATVRLVSPFTSHLLKLTSSQALHF